MAPMIQAKNLWKTYGENVVLEGLNVTVEEGEFITMVGTSGCGKSTFLNMLLGTQALAAITFSSTVMCGNTEYC